MANANSTLTVSTETHLTVSSATLDTRKFFDIVQSKGLRLVAAAPNRIVAGKTFDESITVAGSNPVIQELIESINDGTFVLSE